LKVTLWAAARMSGGLIPLKLNPAPPGVIWEIVRAEPPEFVTVSASVVLLPVGTLPKLRLAGLVVSWPGVTPVPDNGTVSTGLAALEVIAKPPLTLPPEVGANVTLKVMLWPVLSVIGRLGSLAMNPEPVVLAAEIVTVAPAKFVSVTAMV